VALTATVGALLPLFGVQNEVVTAVLTVVAAWAAFFTVAEVRKRAGAAPSYEALKRADKPNQ
jgi:hypothetical protein